MLALTLWSRYPTTFGDDRVQKKSSLPTCRPLMCRWCDSAAATWSLWSRRVEGTLAISSLPTARGSSSRRLEMRLTMGEWARNLSILSVNKTSHKFLFFCRPGYASQHKQHQWQKTGHKVEKMCFLIFIFIAVQRLKLVLNAIFARNLFTYFWTFLAILLGWL